MKRKIIASVIIAALCMFTHIFLGSINPNHPDIRPPQLWLHTLLIGVIIGTVFLAIASIEAWFIRKMTDRIKLIVDALLIITAGGFSVIAGHFLQAI